MKISRKTIINDLLSTTLAELKTHLRITHNLNDDYIEKLGLAVEDFISDLTGFQIRLTEYVILTSKAVISLPYLPTKSITSLQYKNSNRGWVDFPVDYYEVIDDEMIYILRAPLDSVTPLNLNDYLFKLTYRAGRETQINNDQLRMVVHLLTAHWYENNLPVSAVKMINIPFGLRGLINNIRTINVLES